ncbi:hypothetical protein XFLAVUS301_46120 [Xanthobacter flavus]|uniref:Uncharacterized protein n=1 Tax=Xanthobacter flavus TaxID=281 RepID=A0A9W6CW27_XANFL|nr:hypothetical protein XFLAVUS301_46120 [Xanthobacter flavus]
MVVLPVRVQAAASPMPESIVKPATVMMAAEREKGIRLGISVLTQAPSRRAWPVAMVRASRMPVASRLPAGEVL